MTGSLVNSVGVPRGHRASRRRNERGAILIHVAVALLGLLAFSAFSIDHGVMMTSRGQAQTAADAGALAAAMYLAWDDPDDPAGAQVAGVAAAQRNGVWGDTPDITLADVTFPTCPPGAPGPVDECVRVDVYRNQRSGGNPLPVFFSNLIGVADQGVRATATAQVLYGSGGPECLLPFAVPDRWLEQREDEDTDPPGGVPDAVDEPVVYPDDEMDDVPWDPDTDTFDAYETQGQSGGDPLNGVVDVYLEGSRTNGGTGFDARLDHGIRVMLKAGNGSQIAPSWYYPVVLPDGLGNGANSYRTRIQTCTDADVNVGDNFTVEPGNMVGPTRQGVEDLYDQDPSAWWDSTYPNPDGSMGNYFDSAYSRSPRHRAVPLFDVDNYMSGARTGRGEVYITGFAGMFLEGMVGNDVEGYLTSMLFNPDANNLTDDTGSFLRTVILVR